MDISISGNNIQTDVSGSIVSEWRMLRTGNIPSISNFEEKIINNEHVNQHAPIEMGLFAITNDTKWQKSQ